MSDKPKKYDLEDRLIEFAVLVCKIAERLPATRVGNHVGGQLIRCGTSPAPNYGEAQGAESRKDFIHKMRVCLKELRETRVWLKFIKKMELDKSDELEFALRESNELISIFVSSIETAKKNEGK
jgi:four helix bundle protein